MKVAMLVLKMSVSFSRLSDLNMELVWSRGFEQVMCLIALFCKTFNLLKRERLVLDQAIEQ